MSNRLQIAIPIMKIIAKARNNFLQWFFLQLSLSIFIRYLEVSFVFIVNILILFLMSRQLFLSQGILLIDKRQIPVQVLWLVEVRKTKNLSQNFLFWLRYILQLDFGDSGFYLGV